MPRFVILRHEMPAGSTRDSHFDLMLEDQGMLRTWALAELPAPGQAVPAEALAPHRLAYLEYEGEVSGNRGGVNRVEAGEYDLAAETPDSVQIHVSGKTLRGTLLLTRLPEDHWQAAFTSE